MVTYQAAAAAIGADEMAVWLDGTMRTDPVAYAGVSSYGFAISEPIVSTIDRIVPAPAEALPDPWWEDAQNFIRDVEQLIASEVMDTARTAAQAEMVAHGVEEYVWLLNPPSCKRCVPLAGRIYPAQKPRPRHPGCDCIQVPIESKAQAIADGFLLDPMELFEQGLVTGFSKADTRAIQDGADIIEVANATRGGLRTPGITSALTVEMFGHQVKATTAGTTKRGQWRKRNPSRLVRLRPEAIYKFAKDEDDAKRLLELDGYIKAAAPSADPDPDASGGSGRPPAGPRLPVPGAEEPPESDHEYWHARAAATGADLGGETQFAPHEAKFLERFVRDRGERVQWIPSTKVYGSTNDFVWLTNGGIRVELKSTKAKHSTIRGRIEDAVRRRERWIAANPDKPVPPAKSNFIIDLGAAVLTSELREQLAGYNAGRLKYQIVALWVLSDNGTQFEEIDLRK